MKKYLFLIIVIGFLQNGYSQISWGNHIIDDLEKIGSFSPIVADLDGDYDLYIIATSESNDSSFSFIWYKNLDGKGNFGTRQSIFTFEDDISCVDRWGGMRLLF